MVKAGDIGNDARKFVKDDFFTGNEIKINQTGCGKNTTTFKLGDNMKADHKVELSKCPLGSGFAPATFKLNSGVDFEVEGKMNVAGAKTTVTVNTSIDLKTGLKGLSALAATNVGIGFEKNGFQLGVTGTIPNLAAPSFEKAKYAIAMAGCSHFQVAGATTTGMDWAFNGVFEAKGRKIYWDFDYPSLAGTFAWNIDNGKMKIDSTGTVSHYAKYPVSETVALRAGCSWNLHSQKLGAMGMGLDLSL